MPPDVESSRATRRCQKVYVLPTMVGSSKESVANPCCSCVRCRDMKVRCSGSPPCVRCSKRDVECVFPQDDARVTVSQRLDDTGSDGSMQYVLRQQTVIFDRYKAETPAGAALRPAIEHHDIGALLRLYQRTAPGWAPVFLYCHPSPMLARPLMCTSHNTKVSHLELYCLRITTFEAHRFVKITKLNDSCLV